MKTEETEQLLSPVETSGELSPAGRESANVGPQMWRVEEFWWQDASECGSTARLLVDHKAAFSLSADLRDKMDVLRE